MPTLPEKSSLHGFLRRTLLFALIAGIFLVFACTKADESPADKGEAFPGLLHPLDAHFGKRYTSDLPEIIERRYIRVLTTFNRTNFFISGGRLYGFEYSLLKDYEKFLNKSLKRGSLKVVMEFIPVTRDQLIPALHDGRGDIAAAGLTITPERLEKMDFTTPYLTDIDELIVTHRGVAGLARLDDLSGGEVFVRESASYYESLLSLNESLRKKGLRPVRIVKADETLETEDILEMVNSGAISATVSDSHLADLWSRVFKDIDVHPELKVREGGDIAWMVRKSNPELKASLDVFLKKHRRGTLRGNIFFNRYYKNTKWIKSPLGKGITESEAAKLIREYSDRYGFDWQLIMALAFQESGLDNARRSSSGAVGIMQVRPSTARSRDVGIRDVHLLENNIHAGVKYLALLRDVYFNDPGLRARDRIRFALAAYNAGPAKIKRARELAAKMGLDPDRWFRNVEMAALRLIGQETVRYVSNINKYYVLFSLASRQKTLRQEEKKKLTD